jgi:hypothetical protein
MGEGAAVTFNILIKEEDGLCVAHCLELDIVATADSVEQATDDIFDLVVAQVHYAFTNNNLDHLYHPAPPEVWKEFYACQGLNHSQVSLKSSPEPALDPDEFIPPWIIANMCKTSGSCHV